MSENKLPRIGVTMGDPAGIGPEIICKSLADEKVYAVCQPIVIGNASVMQKAASVVCPNQTVRTISDPSEATCSPDVINVIDLPLDYEVEPGKMDVGNGRIAIACMEKVYALISAGKLDATASAPCNKEAMKMAGLPCVGATEFYAKLSGVAKSFAVIDQGGCYIFQATSHLALRKAIEKITPEFIEQTIITSYKTLQQWGLQTPRIALSAFNPHASDGGSMGREDLDILTPAIQAASEKLGAEVAGPVPADALYIKGMQHVYDGIIFLFHDTANIPVKLMEQYTPSVVITGGLPFVRTTVAHGTAYDIAYKGIAGYHQMQNAILSAATISARLMGQN